MDKDKFLTVDYSKANLSEEELRRMQECNHDVISPIDKQIFVGNYRKVSLIEYHCVECGMAFVKEIKNKK